MFFDTMFFPNNLVKNALKIVQGDSLNIECHHCAHRNDFGDFHRVVVIQPPKRNHHLLQRQLQFCLTETKLNKETEFVGDIKIIQNNGKLLCFEFLVRKIHKHNVSYETLF